MKLQTKLLHIAAVCLALVTASMFSYAADSNPKYVPFQGRIHDDTGALNGIYTLKMSMYNTETGGKAIWTEEHKDVSVTYGYVNLLLGATTPFKITKDTVTTDIDFSKANFIGIQISKVSESGSASQFSNELLPRHRMVPSFHAIGADHAKMADEAENANRLDGKGSEYFAKNEDVTFLKRELYITNSAGEYAKPNPNQDNDPHTDDEYLSLNPDQGDVPLREFITRDDINSFIQKPRLVWEHPYLKNSGSTDTRTITEVMISDIFETVDGDNMSGVYILQFGIVGPYFANGFSIFNQSSFNIIDLAVSESKTVTISGALEKVSPQPGYNLNSVIVSYYSSLPGNPDPRFTIRSKALLKIKTEGINIDPVQSDLPVTDSDISVPSSAQSINGIVKIYFQPY